MRQAHSLRVLRILSRAVHLFRPSPCRLSRVRLTLFLLQCLHHRFLAAGLRQMTWSLPHHAYLISPRFAMESTPARSKRSEERRVGKECRVEWWWYFYRIIYNDVY